MCEERMNTMLVVNRDDTYTAVQFTGDNHEQIEEAVGWTSLHHDENSVTFRFYDGNSSRYETYTLGDWVVTERFRFRRSFRVSREQMMSHYLVLVAEDSDM